MPTVQFLYQLHQRAKTAHSALERHQAAFYMWEFGLRFLACVSLTEYSKLNRQSEEIQRLIQNLSRPSLGHWLELTRALVKELADSGDDEFQKVQSQVLGKSTGSLWEVIKLDVAIRQALNPDKEIPSRQTVNVRDLFDRLVQYRNTEWHGFLGGRKNDFYSDMSGPLTAGIWELWQHVDVLAGRQLIFVEEVRRIPDGRYRVVSWDLKHEKSEVLPPLTVSTAEPDTLPLPGRLYLHQIPANIDKEAPFASWKLLYPLALYELPQQELFLYGKTNRNGRVAYVGSMSGEHPQKVTVQDQRGLLEQLLGHSVTGQQIGQWAATAKGPMREDQQIHRRTIGEFDLISRLGSGAYGTVYRAWQPAMRREVALKRLRNPGNVEQRERFSREIQALCRVDHPHLVKVFHSGTDGEDLFFAMELVEGANLERVLVGLNGNDASEIDSEVWQSVVSEACESARRDERPLSDSDDEDDNRSPVHIRFREDTSRFGTGHVRHSVELIRDVADALQCLHDARVLHRDIKPGNIMITPQGEAVVMDLGLAQLGDADTLTMTREFIGTIRYCSPEQAFQSRGVDVRSDIYSLGAAFWELLTLRPFLGITKDLSTDEQFTRIRRTDPEPVAKYNRHVPRDLARVVAKCVEKDETRRYRSMADLVDDLDRWLNGEPVLAEDPSLAYLLRKSIKKHRTAVAAGIAAFVGVIVLTVFAFALRENQRKILSQKNEDLVHQSGRLYIEKGLREYEHRRPRSAAIQLFRAWTLLPEANPFRESARRLAVSRMTSDGRTSRIFPHGEGLRGAKLSANDSRLVTWSDKQAQIWDSLSGRALATIVPELGSIDYVFFSPHGSQLITHARWRKSKEWGSLIDIWKSSDGQRIGNGIKLDFTNPSLEFSRIGHQMAITYSDFNSATEHLAVVELTSGKRIGAIKSEDYRAFRGWNADGSRFLTLSSQQAQLWDASTCERVDSAVSDLDGVLDVAFNPDGQSFASGGEDKKVQIWDAITGDRLGEPMQHPEPIRELLFTKRENLLVTVTSDQEWYDSENTVRVWDLNTRQPIGEPMQHDYAVSKIVISPSTSRIATIADNCLVLRLWDTKTGKQIGKSHDHKIKVRQIEFSPDSARLVTQENTVNESKSRLYLWNAHTGKEVMPPVRSQGFELSPDSLYVSVGLENEVQMRSIKTGLPACETLAGERFWDFSTDGLYVVTGGAYRSDKDYRASFWTIEDSDGIIALKAEEGTSSLAFSPDGARIAVAIGNSLQIWDATTRKQAGELFRHKSPIQSVQFSADGGTILIRSEKDVSLWNATTGKTVQGPTEFDRLVDSWFDPDGTVLSVIDTGQLVNAATNQPIGDRLERNVWRTAYCPNEKRLAVLLESGVVHVYDVATREQIGTPMRHKAFPAAVAISPNGRQVLTDSWSGMIWDVATSKPIWTLNEYAEHMLCVAFSPEGTSFALGSEEGYVRVWDAITRERFGIRKCPGAVQSLVFSPDGQRLVAICGDESASLNGEQPERWILFWEVEPASRGNADLTRWFEYQTGVKIDSEGEITQLSSDEINDRIDSFSNDEQGIIDLQKKKTALRWDAYSRAQDEKNWFAAVFHLRRICDEKPEDDSVRNRLRIFAAQQGDWETVASAIAKGAQLNPDSWSTSNNWYGQALLGSGRHDEFIEWLAEVIPQARASDAVSSWNELALLISLAHFDTHHAATAVELAEKAVTSDKQSWSSHAVLGAALYRDGEFQRAVDALETALELAPKKLTKDTTSSGDATGETAALIRQRDHLVTQGFLTLSYQQIGDLKSAYLRRDAFDKLVKKFSVNWVSRLAYEVLSEELLEIVNAESGTE